MLNAALQGITLTDAQKASLKQLVEKHQAERKQLMSTMQQDTSAREKLMQLRTRHQSEIRALLTPEQQTVFDKNTEEMKKRRGGSMRPAGGMQPSRKQ